RGGKTPRYYQRIAINRTVEAIAKGQNRILLVMATGTGKTFVAAQIIWRLWKAGVKKRILFLADRNILVDQARLNDFKHFGGVMTKIQNRQIEKAYEIYLALYQAVSGTEDWKNIYREFSPDFFDLVVVDECHRGSAAADSAWREILTYFGSATQVGLTATPKETNEVSNIDYFGEPIYTYSLKQGIEDGFLAPYKVVRVNLDIDQGWTPDEGQLDKYGYEIPEEEYNVSDFDRTIVIDERTRQVARRVSDYLKDTSRNDKTIVFCRDIDHAERMRQALIDENGDLYSQNERYVMRITGDNAIGKMELDNFINPEEPYPVLVTTSKLLTTGVDAQTCKLIVLDTIINSMTEFKQIIGRGTRLREDFDKRFFTIMDFRGATRHFRDDDFDGPPIQIYEPDEDDPIVPPESTDGLGDGGGDDFPLPPPIPGDRPKLYVAGVQVEILAERVQYYGSDGQLVLESFKAFSRHNLRRIYQSLDEFLLKWQTAERKEVVMAELLEQGVLLDQLETEFGGEIDPFDLICHVAFDQPPLTRRERANQVKKRDLFGRYSESARQVLAALLDKYASEGIATLEEAANPDTLAPVLKLPPFDQVGSPVHIIKAFGGKPKYIAAVKQLEQELYRIAG
ncbi:MAG: DEAD/DEAH box helicase family protein, partial [Anaerolineae bacterium]|nr:DEAD/DEAH box helicase family protein [Anaerolineae bacterium]